MNNKKKTCKEELIPILHKLLQNTAEERALLSSFYEASYYSDTKPNRPSTQKRRLQTNTPHEYRSKNP